METYHSTNLLNLYIKKVEISLAFFFYYKSTGFLPEKALLKSTNIDCIDCESYNSSK